MLDKHFNPKATESKWACFWEEKQKDLLNQAHFETLVPKDSYAFLLPPPNVTGTLHMGHAFEHTLTDVLARYQIMKGKHVLWQGGCDHAGIATQTLVTRQLTAEGVDVNAMSREALLIAIDEWKENSGEQIVSQMKRMGNWVNWSRMRFTMDAPFVDAVKKTFVQLYREGLIYQGERLVNWDPVLLTAISDLEVINEERDGALYYIHYSIVGEENQSIVVATTRPETLFGDVAIAIKEGDERFQSFVGKSVYIPIINKPIPIIEDADVDPDFGTGFVKITPAHDFNDYAMGQRHGLPLVNIMTPDAHLNENVPLSYQGLDCENARKLVLEALQKSRQLELVKKHTLKVPVGDRSGAIIEPYLTQQWFLKMETMAQSAVEAIEQEQVEIYPPHWKKSFYQWMSSIEDWCISRQLVWGHQIPVWYDTKGNHYSGYDEDEVRSFYGLDAKETLKQDEDVLDTWFSSALWPFVTLGWPEETVEQRLFFPIGTLITGFDILFFWVARMMMLSLKIKGSVPFKKVYLHGLVRDSRGQKMSKSRGNVIDPIDLVEGISFDDLLAKKNANLALAYQDSAKLEKQLKQEYPEGIDAYGADVLRFTLCAISNVGRDVRFDMGRMEGYRNFMNKIWNATRFVLMNLENFALPVSVPEPSASDHWMLDSLAKARHQIDEHLAQFRFDLASQVVFDLVWDRYCDWYLEFSKVEMKDADAQTFASKQYYLIHALDQMLRILHPFVPFITEEIMQHIKDILGFEINSVLDLSFQSDRLPDFQADQVASTNCIINIVSALRSIRSEHRVSPKKTLPITLVTLKYEADIKAYAQWIQALGKISDITLLTQVKKIEASALEIVEGVEIYIPLSHLVDKEKEIARIEKELHRISALIIHIRQQIDNPAFKNNAPKEVLERETIRLKDAVESKQKFIQQLQRIERM